MKVQKERRIWVDDETWEIVKASSKITGLSISAYIRKLALLRLPRQLPPEDFHKIYIELSAIGNNVNQMAKLCNINGSADYSRFSKDLKVIYEARDALFKLVESENL